MCSRSMSDDGNSFAGNEQGFGGQGDRRTKDEEEKSASVKFLPSLNGALQPTFLPPQTRLEETTRGLHRPRKLAQTTGQGFWGHPPGRLAAKRRKLARPHCIPVLIVDLPDWTDMFWFSDALGGVQGLSLAPSLCLCQLGQRALTRAKNKGRLPKQQTGAPAMGKLKPSGRYFDISFTSTLGFSRPRSQRQEMSPERAK
jgi:hypothetical protein